MTIRCASNPGGTTGQEAHLHNGVAFGVGPLALNIGVNPVIALRDTAGTCGALIMVDHTVAGYADRMADALTLAHERFAAKNIGISSLEGVLVGGADHSAWKNKTISRKIRDAGYPIAENDVLGLWYRHVTFDPARGTLHISKEEINPLHTNPAKANLSLEDGSRGFTEGQIGGVVANATRFFRTRSTFTALRELIVPEHLRHTPERPFLLWCAACSNGAEAYSYAMYLHRLLTRARAQCSFHVFATDINERLVAAAAKGVYELRDKEAQHYEKYFSHYGRLEEGKVIFGEEIKRSITFKTFNLKNRPKERRFRAIIAANVFQYYEESAREYFLGNLVSVCDSPGFIYASPVSPKSAARFGLTTLGPYQMLRKG